MTKLQAHKQWIVARAAEMGTTPDRVVRDNSMARFDLDRQGIKKIATSMAPNGKCYVAFEQGGAEQ